MIAGPTCSGKSALALAVARAAGGVVINADSMQVYRELRILTARPSLQEEACVPHRLYGVLPASEAGSVAWWRLRALEEMERAWSAGAVPVLCGGTGMYLRALTAGLAEIPDPGEEARAEARRLAEEIGSAALHARLAAADPETAATLRPSDTQRVSRAWEVWRGTGRGLCAWRREAALPAAACRFRVIRLSPERVALREAIAVRFEAMMAQGAADEVRSLLALGLSPALPAMRAHGVPEIAAMLRGELTEAEARLRAVTATGQYIRRQATWFAHQRLVPEGDEIIFEMENRISEQFMERYMQKILSFIENDG
ncbi:tRNA (adenosine(37)-N6)-dimethylallyltransferase MiaA [Acetobacter sp. AN02]|uniref:tRNA (adenosine(37)-N6)-dimethylallyltransferase MiaA n=1 Tax=Acetobacter sp. AN02 TaxID=2894186 RepID=UPI0024342D45|nr:tRNA (adenosine(37)-N6)-dimethylallyltransferase MiaA [Acetobacter sp. AN02]MDG6094890.1 tRNA (adenosine(37)-N6)-dimethylallyltransferase MiaA [Acetobacter sp. AN02]